MFDHRFLTAAVLSLAIVNSAQSSLQPIPPPGPVQLRRLPVSPQRNALRKRLTPAELKRVIERTAPEFRIKGAPPAFNFFR